MSPPDEFKDTDENDLKMMTKKLDADCAVLVYVGRSVEDSGILFRWRNKRGRVLARLLQKRFDEWMSTLPLSNGGRHA